MKKIIFGLIAVTGLVGLCSFGLKKGVDNDRLGKELYPKLKLPKSWKYIPKKDEKVGSFYMLETEVTNLHYLEFLAWEKNKDSVKALEYQPVQGIWGEEKQLEEWYQIANKFRDYPVLGVDIKRAEAYCVFLTEAINKVLKGANSAYQVKAELPSTAEWQWAAFGGLNPEQNYFPWGGSYLMNAQKEDLANYRKIGQLEIDDQEEQLVVKEDPKCYDAFLDGDCGKRTTPGVSYFPNGYGLYNMSGNAAELTKNEQILGGDWNSIAKYLMIKNTRPFESASNTIGFRPILRVIKQ